VLSALVWAYVLLVFGDIGMGVAKWFGLTPWFK
jgi:hypothetical protein